MHHKKLSKYYLFWLLLILILVSLFPVSCKTPNKSQSESDDIHANAPTESETKSEEKGQPSLSIKSPKKRETIKGSTVTVKVDVKNVTLVDVPGRPNNPSEGHLHVSLKTGGKAKSVTTAQEKVDFTDVAPGDYIVEVELANNDHSSLEPPLDQTIAISVAP